ncbi:MAG: hypothetical protein V2A78_14000 [bacterium]
MSKAKKKNGLSPEIEAVIAAALTRYLKDDKLSFQVVSIKPVQTGQINLWALTGRQENMRLPSSGGPAARH